MNTEPDGTQFTPEYVKAVVSANAIARRAKLVKIATGGRIRRIVVDSLIGIVAIIYFNWNLHGWALLAVNLVVFGLLGSSWDASRRIDAVVELLEQVRAPESPA
jgi:hypothetical protein